MSTGTVEGLQSESLSELPVCSHTPEQFGCESDLGQLDYLLLHANMTVMEVFHRPSFCLIPDILLWEKFEATIEGNLSEKLCVSRAISGAVLMLGLELALLVVPVRKPLMRTRRPRTRTPASVEGNSAPALRLSMCRTAVSSSCAAAAASAAAAVSAGPPGGTRSWIWTGESSRRRLRWAKQQAQKILTPHVSRMFLMNFVDSCSPLLSVWGKRSRYGNHHLDFTTISYQEESDFDLSEGSREISVDVTAAQGGNSFLKSSLKQ